MKTKTVFWILVAAAISGCKDGPERLGPEVGVEIHSDPPGATIEIDSVHTGRVTPAIFRDLVGQHFIRLYLVRDANTYEYSTTVTATAQSLQHVSGPLLTACNPPICSGFDSQSRTFGRVHFLTHASGVLFNRGAADGEGLVWPAGSNDKYITGAMPAIAMFGAGDRWALPIYAHDYMNGRPAPQLTTINGRAYLRQTAWIMPPDPTSEATVRGVEVGEEVFSGAHQDVVYVKLTFRNVTDRADYRTVDPFRSASGATFSSAYVGLTLDPDIGASNDDFVTYEPALNMVYAYDADFAEGSFGAAGAAAPGLVGLRVINKPETASVVLNTWSRTSHEFHGDWRAVESESKGYDVLSGILPNSHNEPGEKMGYVPTIPGDLRMSAMVGPLVLNPGDEVSVTLAVIMAAPATGQYTSGALVAPGSPVDTTRQIRKIASGLIETARNVIAP